MGYEKTEAWVKEQSSSILKEMETVKQESSTVSVGFEMEGFSAGQEHSISKSRRTNFARTFSRKFSESVTMKEKREHCITKAYPDIQNGRRTLWQWQYVTQYGVRSLTTETNFLALTEGNYMPPLCEPGMSEDDRHYQKCRAYLGFEEKTNQYLAGWAPGTRTNMMKSAAMAWCLKNPRCGGVTCNRKRCGGRRGKRAIRSPSGETSYLKTSM